MELTLRELGERDVEALQSLLESDPDYTERVTGYPPGPADALSLLMMRPGGLPEDRKVVLGAAQRYAGQWPEARWFRLAVVDTNAGAAGFWERIGFAATGEARPDRYDHLESTTRLFDRDLRA